MLVYVGQTRSRALIARLAELGFGECTNRGEWPPRRRPWFLDNGAFSDWRSSRDFDGAAFLCDLISAVAAAVLPDFIVCPDRVAIGLESLAFSLRWRTRCEFVLRARRAAGYRIPCLRWYFVVQDGMSTEDVAPIASQFDGIFVGGSLAWKIATSAQWVTFAHERGMPCHVGRVGTAKRVAWAHRIWRGLDRFVPAFVVDGEPRPIRQCHQPGADGTAVVRGELYGRYRYLSALERRRRRELLDRHEARPYPKWEARAA